MAIPPIDGAPTQERQNVEQNQDDEPYMTHVAPGKTQTMLWQFTQAGEFHYACLIPGPFEAGMVGAVTARR